MEMEKINDNTIRVLLENEDLTERGITVLDLLGNQSEIESFFFSILDEVDENHEFRNNEAVTFQLMPNRTGLELLITKSNPSAEKTTETDEETAKLEEADNNTNNEAHNSLTEELANYLRNHLDEEKLSRQSSNKGVGSGENDDYFNFQGELYKRYLVNFTTFDDFVDFAKAFPYADESSADLYAYNGQYFLELALSNEEMTAENMKDALALAYEYGNKVEFSVDLVRERGKLIMDGNAIELAQHQF